MSERTLLSRRRRSRRPATPEHDVPSTDASVVGANPLPPPTVPPPTWAPDPLGRFQLRYWDGTRWTAHVSSWWRQEIDAEFTDA